MVFDRLGAEARASGGVELDPNVPRETAFAALATNRTLIVAPAIAGPGYVADRSLDVVASLRDYAEAVLDALATGDEVPEQSRDQSRAEEKLSALLFLASFDAAPLETERISYRPAPAVVLVSQTLAGERSEVDVVANPRLSVRLSDAGPELDPLANLRAGVWETRTEGLILGDRARTRMPGFDAFAAPAATPVTLVAEPEVATLAGRWPAATLAAVREDLSRGYRVVVPSNADPENIGWWRIDPATGEALGRGGDGRGQSAVEEAIFTISIPVNVAFSLGGAYQCNQIEDRELAGCCHVQNIAGTIIGLFAGGVAGLKWASDAAAKGIFIASDIGGNLALLLLPTFCPGR
jgi:hypothetical protein